MFTFNDSLLNSIAILESNLLEYFEEAANRLMGHDVKHLNVQLLIGAIVNIVIVPVYLLIYLQAALMGPSILLAMPYLAFDFALEPDMYGPHTKKGIYY